MAINRKHVDKIFSQKYSLLDHKMLEKYFEDHELNNETERILTEQWTQFDPDFSNKPQLDHVFYKLLDTINLYKDPIWKKNYLNISKIAAIFIIGVLIASNIYFISRNRDTKNEHEVVFVSHDGLRNQFILPDGTTGCLGPESVLKYSTSGNQRIVRLNGLAYFDVVHSDRQPFVVKTPAKLNVEVMGTKFNISSYQNEKNCEVILEQGKVRLSLFNQEIAEMAPKERVLFKSENNSIEKTRVIVDDYLAWKDGKLVLRNISLKEACTKLSRYYNVDFELQAKGLDEMGIQLTLENETLENALTLLTMISPVQYQIEKRKALPDQSFSRKKIYIKNK